MTKKISETFVVLLIVCVLSLGFWKALENTLEDFFFWQITKTLQTPEVQVYPLLTTSLLKPSRNWKIPELKIKSNTAISVEIDSKIPKKILFKKNIDQRLPIASLTKLMTACIVLENYDLSQTVAISQSAVEQEGESGNLKKGEMFTVKDLLSVMLMESSNDAAWALTEIMGEKKFVGLMNSRAKKIGLKDTHFVNSTGLDLEEFAAFPNYSSAEDLVELAKYLLKEPLIWEILSTPELDIYGSGGLYYHQVLNTNKLLGEIPGIVGGKTGWTAQAQGCFLLVLKNPNSNKFLINVILGSEDRFGEMKKLIDWVYQAYKW